MLTNLSVRRRAEGGYEIISGHRRFHAAQRAGLDRVKVQVRDIDDDQAIIDMVDSNIQREHISPMENAKAYAMKLNAIKHQGSRTDLTSGQIVQKLSVEKVAEGTTDGYKTIQRFKKLCFTRSASHLLGVMSVRLGTRVNAARLRAKLRRTELIA